MGSGHFLVEVVDTTSNRLIDFLNGWSENPVWAFLEQTRQDILDEMERQHVTLDAERLTRVALLETRGAQALRLWRGPERDGGRTGQSLVVAGRLHLGRAAEFPGSPPETRQQPDRGAGGEVQAALQGQQTLFSQSKFAGVMLATDLMRQVSYLSDNTVAQARQSAQRLPRRPRPSGPLQARAGCLHLALVWQHAKQSQKGPGI